MRGTVRGLSGGRAGAGLAAGLAVLALLLAIAQALLPGFAAARLRGRLQAHGQVRSVSVSAFPALELLWGQADSVTVRMDSYDVVACRVGPDGRSRGSVGDGGARGSRGGPMDAIARLASFLRSTAATGELAASAGRFIVGRLVLDDATLAKRGSLLRARVLLKRSALAAALPRALVFQPVSGPAGALRFRAGVRLLGRAITVTAQLAARGGALVIEPDLDGFFVSQLSLTAFRARGIRVLSVSTRAVAHGWLVLASARLS